MNFDKYENKKSRHLSPEQKELYKNTLNHLDAIPLTVKDREERIQKLKEDEKNELKDVRKVYNEETTRLDELFRKDVEEELFPDGLPDYVKSKIHSLAWEEGHHHGLQEVYNCYNKYLDLAEICVNSKS